MIDKELLELAAKAAGIETTLFMDQLRDTTGFHPSMNIYAAKLWNPLTDDGDALRLAVKLEMTIDFCEGKIWHNRIEIDFGGGGDQNEHARRAIVRAAAEIGKGMK